MTTNTPFLQINQLSQSTECAIHERGRYYGSFDQMYKSMVSAKDIKLVISVL